MTESPQNENEWTLAICGDWAPWQDTAKALLADPAAYYGDVLPVLQKADLAIVNLEGVLGDDHSSPIVKDGMHIGLAAPLTAGLKAVPFHLACLANNHTLDYGPARLGAMQGILAREGIRSLGAGATPEAASAPAFWRFGETRLAVLNVAEGEEARAVNGGPGVAPLDLPALRQQIAALKAQGNVVVLIVHAGREHLPVPAPYIREQYRSLAEAGASLVIGHHPHVPQGIETYRGTPIAYSLGNFALWVPNTWRYHHIGYLVEARFRGRELVAFTPRPYRIEPQQMRLLAGEEGARFQAELDELSALIPDDERLNALWDAYADRWLVDTGLDEMGDSLAELGRGKALLRAVLKASLPRYAGNSLGQRLMRRLLGWGLNSLSKTSPSRNNTAYAQTMNPQGAGPSPTTEASRHAAAVLRNRFDTPAHRELYLHALRRVMDRSAGSAPGWAYQQISQWYAATDPLPH